MQLPLAHLLHAKARLCELVLPARVRPAAMWRTTNQPKELPPPHGSPFPDEGAGYHRIAVRRSRNALRRNGERRQHCGRSPDEERPPVGGAVYCP